MVRTGIVAMRRGKKSSVTELAPAEPVEMLPEIEDDEAQSV
jgi:hypothetical protein